MNVIEWPYPISHFDMMQKASEDREWKHRDEDAQQEGRR